MASQTLADYFEQHYLPHHLAEAAPNTLKRFRQALARGEQHLGRPLAAVDVLQRSFPPSFVAYLEQLGFTHGRAEALAFCLKEIAEACRPSTEPQRKRRRGDLPPLGPPMKELIDEGDWVTLAELSRLSELVLYTRSLKPILTPQAH